MNQSRDWQLAIRGGFAVFFDLATQEAGTTLITRRDLLGRIGTTPRNFGWSDETSRPVELAPWLNFLFKMTTR